MQHVPRFSCETKLLGPRILKFILFLVFSNAISDLISSAFAQDKIEIVISENGLNLRDEPNQDSRVIATLEHRRVVLVLEEHGDWSRVATLSERTQGDVLTGWVASRFLSNSSQAQQRSMRSAPSNELQVDVLGFKCHTDIVGNGYAHCELEVSVSLSGPNWVNTDVPIECEATVETRTKDDIWPSRVSGSSFDYLYVLNGYGHIYVHMGMSVSRIVGDVISARLSDLECWAR